MFVMKASKNERFLLRIGFGIVGIAIGTSGFISGCRKANAQTHEDSTPDRVVDLAIYKEDFAMVSETRSIDLDAGHHRLVIDRVSRSLDPNSVLFDWADDSPKAQVVATTYDLGVGASENLLRRLNGQQVDMLWRSTDGKPGQSITGRLETMSGGNAFAIRTDDKLYINPDGTIVASGAATTGTSPQLSVEVESEKRSNSKLNVSYLTRGLSWSASYTAKLSPNSDQAEVQCWAAVTNTTGITFPNAHISLMAGSPNRSVKAADATGEDVFSPARSMAKMATGGANRRDKQEQMRYESVGEIYAYKVPSTASIGQDQMNRVSMLGTRTVPIKKDYAVRLPELNAWSYDEGQATPNHVRATLSIAFENDKNSDLGMPLPAGEFRVYDRVSNGKDQFVGSAGLPDTAKDERVNMTISDVFDVYAQYRVVSTKKVDKHTLRKVIQVVTHNERNQPTVVRLVQSTGGLMHRVEESELSKKLDSTTSQWTITVPSGQEKRLTYTVDLRA